MSSTAGTRPSTNRKSLEDFDVSQFCSIENMQLAQNMLHATAVFLQILLLVIFQIFKQMHR